MAYTLPLAKSKFRLESTGGVDFMYGPSLCVKHFGGCGICMILLELVPKNLAVCILLLVENMLRYSMNGMSDMS